MKAEGHLNKIINDHNKLHRRDAQGWALACVGTKRVSYLAFDTAKEPFIYDENEIRVFPSHLAACFGIDAWAKREPELYMYMRLVAIADNPNVKGGQLPTVNGY